MVSIHEDKGKCASYISLKTNYRVGKKVKSKYIYLGASEIAVRILHDMQSKPLIDENEISYSGETILTKLANSVGFESVITKYTKDKRISRVLKNIVVLRLLFPESKRKLVKVRLKNSILKDSTNLKYLGEVYKFMDAIYDHLGDVLYELAKNAIRKYSLDLKYLIIDATRLKVYKNKDTDLIKPGYSGKERRDLRQANLIMGVNGQQIPFFVEIYPGNTVDSDMFGPFIKHIRCRYRLITKKSQKTIIIIDQGNVNEKNIKCLHGIKKSDIYFAAMVPTQMMGRFIEKVDKSKMKVVYTKKEPNGEETNTCGTLIQDEELHGVSSNVLVCYNPDIAKHKCKKLNKNVGAVKERAKSVNESKNMSLDDKYADVASLIKNYCLKRAIEPIKDEKQGILTLEIDDDELKARRKRYGFFGIFTDDKDLSAKELIRVYKTRDLIEKGFEVLKSELEICPVNHSRDDRIENHAVLVIYGYFLLSLLKAILSAKGIEYSFGELKEIIKSRHAMEGFFEHELLENKRLYIMRPINPGKKLEKIFKTLRIKTPKYEVKECIPTG